MSNAVYPEFRRALLDGSLGDVTGLAWTIQPIDNTILYDPAHLVFDDVDSAALGDPVVLSTIAIAVGTATVDVTCDDSALALTGLTSGMDVNAVVVFLDSGSPATSTLVAYLDRRADSSPVAFSGVTGSIPFTVPFGYVVRI